MYVIESSWAWDKSHTEYATLSLEGWKYHGKSLEDPSCLEAHKQIIFEILRKIARFQNGGRMGSGDFVAIHRVLSFEEKNEENGEKKVVFRLKPVFRFDEDGKPVVVP